MEPPEFDLSEWKVQPLSCSKKDKIWVMTLPNITSTEISPVTVEMKHGLLKTLFSVSGNRVTLSDLGLETIVSEDGCPFESDVTLEFTLESALLGSNIVELSIPIKLDSGSFDFAGFVIEEE